MRYSFDEFRKLRSKMPKAKRRHYKTDRKVLHMVNYRVAFLLLDGLVKLEKTLDLWNGESQ